MFEDQAWIPNSCMLARQEVLRANEPPVWLCEFWPPAKVSCWASQREDEGRAWGNLGERFDRSCQHDTVQHHKSSRNGKNSSGDPLSALLKCSGFRPWAWAVHDPLGNHLGEFVTCVNQDATSQQLIAIKTLLKSLRGAIAEAHREVNDLDELVYRLKVLRSRFHRLSSGSSEVDGSRPISTDFGFLTRLLRLDLRLYGQILSHDCHQIYKNSTPDDFRSDKSEQSRRLSNWWNSLNKSGAECVEAGLEGSVAQLADILWDYHDHHSSFALQNACGEDIGKHSKRTYDWWEGGVLPYLGLCQKRIVTSKEAGAAGKRWDGQRDYIMKIISNVDEWGEGKVFQSCEEPQSSSRSTSGQTLNQAAVPIPGPPPQTASRPVQLESKSRLPTRPEKRWVGAMKVFQRTQG